MNPLHELRQIVAATGDKSAMVYLEHWIARTVQEYGCTFCISHELQTCADEQDLAGILVDYDRSIGRRLGEAILRDTKQIEDEEEFGTTYRRRVLILREST